MFLKVRLPLIYTCIYCNDQTHIKRGVKEVRRVGEFVEEVETTTKNL